MQILQITDNHGVTRDLKIIRSFSRNASTSMIVEFTDGSFGFTNGERALKIEQLDFLPEPHLSRAMAYLKELDAPKCETEKKAENDLTKMDKKSLAALAGLDEEEAKKVMKSDIVQMLTKDE